MCVTCVIYIIVNVAYIHVGNCENSLRNLQMMDFQGIAMNHKLHAMADLGMLGSFILQRFQVPEFSIHTIEHTY